MRAQEFVTEKINPETIRPDFHAEKTIGGFDLRAHGNDRGTGVIIKAYHQGEEIGFARFLAKRDDRGQPALEASFVYTNEHWRRRGVARAIYQFAQELGNDIKPSNSQTDLGKAFWAGGGARPAMATMVEGQMPSIRGQIAADAKKHGPGAYFVRFTDTDKLGFSDRQWFGKTPDVDDPDFDIDQIGSGQGRRVLWFYPLEYYLSADTRTYGMQSPYAWLVKLKPNAWLQTVRRGDTEKQQAPAGKQRVGILRMTDPPAALFFQPGFNVVGRYYDYAGQHKRHGRVQGRPPPTFFDRVRGDR